MPNLPSIVDRPDSNVVIYDGQCRFCTGSVTRLNQLDWRKQLSFISLHEPAVATNWPDLTHEQLMDQMYVVDKHGNRRGGARAFQYLSTILPPLWPLVPFVHLPFAMKIGQWCYRIVARQRYRWGKVKCDDTCEIHFN